MTHKTLHTKGEDFPFEIQAVNQNIKHYLLSLIFC